MKVKIKKAPATELEVNIFRHSDDIYLDIEKEQYVLSLKEILTLEDLDKRSHSVSNN